MECQTTNLNWWPQDFWTINPYEPSINPQYKKPMVSNPSNPWAWNQRSRHLAWGDGFSEGVVSSLPRCHGHPGKKKINIPSRELTFFSQKWHFESMIFNFSKLPQVFSFSKRWDMLIPWRVFHICNKNRIIVALVLGWSNSINMDGYGLMLELARDWNLIPSTPGFKDRVGNQPHQKKIHGIMTKAAPFSKVFASISYMVIF